jgi:hypothetical protein
MIPLHRNNPRPVPPICDLVANFVKSLGSISESNPVSVSLMLTTILIIVILSHFSFPFLFYHNGNIAFSYFCLFPYPHELPNLSTYQL